MKEEMEEDEAKENKEVEYGKSDVGGWVEHKERKVKEEEEKEEEEKREEGGRKGRRRGGGRREGIA